MASSLDVDRALLRFFAHRLPGSRFEADRPPLHDEVRYSVDCPLGGPRHTATLTGLDVARTPYMEVLIEGLLDQLLLCDHDLELGPAGRPSPRPSLRRPEPVSATDWTHEGSPFRG